MRRRTHRLVFCIAIYIATHTYRGLPGAEWAVGRSRQSSHARADECFESIGTRCSPAAMRAGFLLVQGGLRTLGIGRSGESGESVATSMEGEAAPVWPEHDEDEHNLPQNRRKLPKRVRCPSLRRPPPVPPPSLSASRHPSSVLVASLSLRAGRSMCGHHENGGGEAAQRAAQRAYPVVRRPREGHSSHHAPAVHCVTPG